MKPHIFFNSDIDSADDWRAALATEFDDFMFSTLDDLENPESVDIALVWKIPKGGLDQFVNLRAILSLGAGINQLDPKDLPAHVPLARLVDESLTRTMVEYAKTAVYRYHRCFHVFERHSREAIWKFITPRLAGDTKVGILGLGEIGGAIAVALVDEGFDVRGWSRTPKEVTGVPTHTGGAGLAAMAGACDILVNVLPLTNDTRHILSRGLFSQCRPGTCLVNMGRGLHLVEPDLLEAIDSKLIDGATLDVTAVEPLPPQHPFWNHPNILITPHLAGISIPMTGVKNIAANIRRAMAGEPITNQVDLVRGY